MDGEDSRDKRASPKKASHLPKNQEKRYYGRDVKQDIGEVI